MARVAPRGNRVRQRVSHGFAHDNGAGSPRGSGPWAVGLAVGDEVGGDSGDVLAS
jgi:hypothetical protein